MEVGTLTQASKRGKRRWVRYSLRAFLVVVTLICIVVGWEASRARRQGEAVREVERLGGVVRFDYQLDEKGALVSDAEPPAPAWLRDALGEEHFRRVIALDLSYGGPRLGENQITDERLAILGGVPDLTTLELGRELGITDDGLVHLRHLKKLKTLYLYNTGVEGPGLQHLSRLRNLESINLHGAPLTDEGLRHLAKLPRLKWIHLGGTRITDEGLKHLAGAQSLREVQLSDTDVTDAGLEHVKRLSGLNSLSLARTLVTAKGVLELQKALPKCTVFPPVEQFNRKPMEIALWPEGERPTANELMARAKVLGVDFRVQWHGRPGNPIITVSLMNSDISADSLLRLLANTPEVEILNLRDLVVGDELVRNMPVLPNLRYLMLQGCRITDEALPHLVKHTNLQELNLDENYITDKGVALLKELPKLERVSFSNNRVTYKARLELKRARPQWQMPL
jgi:Leucine-rich repeat (LRR) protein